MVLEINVKALVLQKETIRTSWAVETAPQVMVLATKLEEFAPGNLQQVSTCLGTL